MRWYFLLIMMIYIFSIRQTSQILFWSLSQMSTAVKCHVIETLLYLRPLVVNTCQCT